MLTLLAALASSAEAIAETGTALAELSPERYLSTRAAWSAAEALEKLERAPDEVSGLGAASDPETFHWFLVPLPPCPGGGGCRLLVPFPSFDEVTFWLLDDGVPAAPVQDGDAYPVPEGARVDPRYVLAVPPGPGRAALIRVRTGGFLAMTLLWAAAPDYLANLALMHVWYGLFFGGMLILALYNAFLYLALRDRNFLTYAAYVTCLALFIAVFTGYGRLFLWPGIGGLSDTMVIVATCLSVLFGLAFCFGFLREANFGPFIHWTGRLFMGVAVLLIAAIVLGASYAHVVRWTTVLAYLAMATYLLLALLGLVAGVREARFLVVAFSMFFLGMILHQLHIMSLIPSNLLTRHASEVGALLEATLLSFALADRIETLNREKARLENEALEAQRSFSRQLIQAQESERQGVSQALHDGVGHGLLVVKGFLERDRAGGRNDRGTDMAAYCGELLDSVRNLSHTLHPHILERLELGSALEAAMAQALDPRDIDWFCEVSPCDADLSPDARLALYRVAQEAISNALKHGDPGEVILLLERDADRVVMRIKDDGRGFDVDTAADGIGVINMRGRLELLGGRLTLASQPGAGCEVRAELPLSRAA
jgi:signal transduction histidine kinase